MLSEIGLDVWLFEFGGDGGVLRQPSIFSQLAEATPLSLATEVNPVVRALRSNGIEVEAIHNHMLMDEPHLYFMRYWENYNALKLARGLRAALDQTNSARAAKQ